MISDISGLASWNTGNVTRMGGMFYDCFSLTNVDALASWDTDNVTDMNFMFFRCKKYQFKFISQLEYKKRHRYEWRVLWLF